MDAAAFEGKCRTSPANESSPRAFLAIVRLLGQSDLSTGHAFVEFE